MNRLVVSSCAALAIFAGAATAQVVTIADGNSDAEFDLGGGGQFNWHVDGLDELFNQDFFFRAGAMTDELSVTSTGIVGHTLTDTNFFVDPRVDTLFVRYFDAPTGLEFDIRYSLQGGSAGSGTADLAEQIIIRNVGNAATDVSFFQYVDFDLNGSSGGDVGEILNGRVATQSEGGMSVTETVVTPAPSFYDMKEFPDIILNFFDGLPTTLSNDPGPVAGDLAWAFQWDFSLAPGQTFLISKDKLITPAPGAIALLGIAGLAGCRRRRA